MKLVYALLLLGYATSCLGIKLEEACPDVTILYDAVLSEYNHLTRPGTNVTDIPTVTLTLELSESMAINLKKLVDSKQIDHLPGGSLVHFGDDLREFYLLVKWVIPEVPANRNEEFCPYGAEPFSDVTFNFTKRRNPLFNILDLIISFLSLTLLAILVFYIPSDSEEKKTAQVNEFTTV